MSKKHFNIRQHYLFHDYYSRLKQIAMVVHEWDNLPDTCNARFLEKCLFENGHAIFVEDADMSFLNLRVTPSGTLNVYDEPLTFTAYSTTYNKEYTADNCVYIRNNYQAKSTDSTIIIYAEKLANLDLTIEVNINAQKTPVLIRTDDKTKNSLDMVYNHYEGNKPVIFATKGLQEKPFEVLKTDAPYIADRLREEKRAVWNEALEFLGINTNPSDKKKERLVVNEVDANNEQIEIQGSTMLSAREDAVKLINKKYGLSVSVRKRDMNEIKNMVEEGVL